MSEIDALYLLMKGIWVMISLVTLTLILRYYYRIGQAGERLFKKPFALSFSVGLALVYLVIFIKQIVSYFQSGSDYFIYIAVGFFLLTLYMWTQCMNELLIHEHGFSYNMKYTKWENVTDYQIANKDHSKVFKVTVNKKNFLFKTVKKNHIFSVTVEQGEEISRLLKDKVLI